MIPQTRIITEQIEKEQSQANKPIGRSFFFDFKTNTFTVEAGKVRETTEEEALKQWISLCIYTQIDKFKVYEGTGFGTDIESLIGYRDFDSFYYAEMKRLIPEALLINRAIEDVEILDIGKNGDVVNVKLIVRTEKYTLEVEASG